MSELDKKDLFISYEWGSKEIVSQIANSLEEIYKYKVWIDRNQIFPGLNLHENIQKGINNSEIILAFVTKRYCESQNCQLEIQYANRIKKKIIYIVLEKLKVDELPNGMGVLLAENLCFNVYSEPWTHRMLDELDNSIISIKNKKHGFV